MEYWLNSRGYVIVEPQDVQIAGYEFIKSQPEDAPMFEATSIDRKIPYILEKLFANTVSVRVVCQESALHPQIPKKRSRDDDNATIPKSRRKQMFLFVRNAMEKTFSKKDLVIICEKYITLAKCIIFTTGVPPLSTQMLYRKGAECGHPVEIMPLKDVMFRKLHFRMVPQYALLNEAEILELETRLKTKRADLPRLPMSDAITRYHGLRPGQVVRKPDDSYRIVMFSGGGGGEKASDKVKKTALKV